MVGPGKRIGDRYLVDGLLARGGMADVYRARDLVLDRPVAVKVLRVGAADARRFETETRLLGVLEHRNLVPLLDAGQRSGVPYLVFELIEGPTLTRRLARGPLSGAEARRLGCDIARALAYVHAQGVVHRDVKPSNILLAPDGRALLSDFGVARLLTEGARQTAAGATIGTAAYLAPEQLGGDDVTGAADIYAMGLVLIEALSGRPAFTGTPQEVLAARMTSAPRIPEDLELPWPGLLRAMTRPDPADRPDAAAIAAHLRTPPAADLATEAAELDTTEIDALPAQATRRLADPTPQAPALSSPELRPVLWLLAALVALAGLAAFVIASGDTDDEAPPDQAADVTASSATTLLTTTTLATTTTTVPSTTTSQPAGASLADTCASLDARKQAIDTEKQQVDDTYRDDPETRERLKNQLEDEKQAIDAQKQALGC